MNPKDAFRRQPCRLLALYRYSQKVAEVGLPEIPIEECLALRLVGGVRRFSPFWGYHSQQDVDMEHPVDIIGHSKWNGGVGG